MTATDVTMAVVTVTVTSAVETATVAAWTALYPARTITANGGSNPGAPPIASQARSLVEPATQAAYSCTCGHSGNIFGHWRQWSASASSGQLLEPVISFWRQRSVSGENVQPLESLVSLWRHWSTTGGIDQPPEDTVIIRLWIMGRNYVLETWSAL